MPVLAFVHFPRHATNFSMKAVRHCSWYYLQLALTQYRLLIVLRISIAGNQVVHRNKQLYHATVSQLHPPPICSRAILDIFSAIVIMVPLILPVADSYGIDPVHLGIIFLANMQIGYVTPPVGMNLFIASYRFGKPIVTLYRAAVPFMIVLLIAVLVITYVPELSLSFINKEFSLFSFIK